MAQAVGCRQVLGGRLALALAAFAVLAARGRLRLPTAHGPADAAAVRWASGALARGAQGVRRRRTAGRFDKGTPTMRQA